MLETFGPKVRNIPEVLTEAFPVGIPENWIDVVANVYNRQRISVVGGNRVFDWVTFFLIVYTRFLYVMAATRQNRMAKPDNAAYCPHRSATVAPFR